MKLYIIFTLALLTFSAYAGFGLNVTEYMASKTSGIIDEDNLKYIIQSQYNQYVVVTSFFSTGDLTGDGQLTSAEFAVAYSAFIKFVLGETASTEFLAIRWELATWDQDQEDYIDLAAFTFLVTLDLRFVYDNYCLFNGNLETLGATVTKIETMLADVSTSDLISAIFFGFDYDKDDEVTPAEFRSGFRILGYVLGVNVSYTSALLNDLFAGADADGDMVLSTTEVTTFVNDHLTVIQGLLSSLAALETSS